MSAYPARVLTIGYPSLDHIARVQELGAPGTTRIIDARWPTPTLGGCAANVAVALARLGVSVMTSFAVGDDPDSDAFLSAMKRVGVDTSAVLRRAGMTMPRSYLFLDGRDDSELYFDPGAMQHWEGPESIDLAEVGRVVVTVGPLEANERVIEMAESKGIPIALQLKRDLTAFHPGRLHSLLAHCDVVFANEAEIAFLRESLGKRTAQELLDTGPSWLVETRGSAGAVIHHSRGSQTVPVVRPGGITEPTGAGDAFTAGVVFGLISGASPMTAARIGAVLASYAVEAWGCQTGLPDLRGLRERYQAAFGEALGASPVQEETT